MASPNSAASSSLSSDDLQQAGGGNPNVRSGANIASQGDSGIGHGVGAGQGMSPLNIGKDPIHLFDGVDVGKAGVFHSITANSAFGGNMLENLEGFGFVQNVGGALSGIQELDGVGKGMGLGQMSGLPHHDFNTLKGGSDREQN